MLMYRGIRHYCAVYYMYTKKTMGHNTDSCPDSDQLYERVIIFLSSALHSVSVAVVQAGQLRKGLWELISQEDIEKKR